MALLKKKVIDYECFDFLYSSCLKYFSFLEEFSEILSSEMYTVFAHSNLRFLSVFNNIY